MSAHISLSAADVIDVVGILVALTLGVAGIFQDKIRQLLMAPTLGIDAASYSETSSRVPARAIHDPERIEYRLRVNNESGRFCSDATNIEASIVKATFTPHQPLRPHRFSFLPIRLVWAHSQACTLERLPRGHSALLHLGDLFKSEDIYLGTSQLELSSLFDAKTGVAEDRASSFLFRLATESWPRGQADRKLLPAGAIEATLRIVHSNGLYSDFKLHVEIAWPESREWDEPGKLLRVTSHRC